MKPKNSSTKRIGGAALALALIPGGAMAQDFRSDVIIEGSLCAGLDCVSGENFGFDTLRVKENNLRIHFNDTSTSASFPTNDWRIVANDSNNGGANYLAIEDSDAGRQTFKVEAGARANALVVDSNSRVGMGTDSPVVRMHAVDGNTPALRLEQDGSSGFSTQIWDMAGNETSFFVRDVTHSSKLPFRIFPDSPGDALNITSSGVGVSTKSPQATLHVGEAGTTQLRITDTNANGAQQLLRLENDGTPEIFMTNTKNNKSWLINAGGSLTLSPSENALANVFKLTNTGNLEIDGALTQSSDKTRKMAIEQVNADAVLAKVVELPVAEWTYIHDAEDGTRHMGPMAQDFHAAFGLGANELGISALDGTGVALAAIQALHAQNLSLRAELDAVLETVESLQAAD